MLKPYTQFHPLTWSFRTERCSEHGSRIRSEAVIQVVFVPSSVLFCSKALFRVLNRALYPSTDPSSERCSLLVLILVSLPSDDPSSFSSSVLTSTDPSGDSSGDPSAGGPSFVSSDDPNSVPKCSVPGTDPRIWSKWWSKQWSKWCSKALFRVFYPSSVSNIRILVPSSVSKFCIQGSVSKALYPRLCIQGSVSKALYPRLCIQGSVPIVMIPVLVSSSVLTSTDPERWLIQSVDPSGGPSFVTEWWFQSLFRAALVPSSELLLFQVRDPGDPSSICSEFCSVPRFCSNVLFQVLESELCIQVLLLVLSSSSVLSAWRGSY
jgi:hypothetical protein